MGMVKLTDKVKIRGIAKLTVASVNQSLSGGLCPPVGGECVPTRQLFHEKAGAAVFSCFSLNMPQGT